MCLSDLTRMTDENVKGTGLNPVLELRYQSPNWGLGE